MIEMNIAMHTPGPWEIHSAGQSEDGAALFVLWPHRDNIKNRFNRISDVKGDSNARLIAAAPELLAALKRTVEVLDAEGIIYGNCDNEPLDVLSSARDAIAKAEVR